jgi:hypothetical protein
VTVAGDLNARISVLNRELAGIPPYALVVNQPLARRREQLLFELGALTAGADTRINQEEGPNHGRREST